ncbi:unnamed protein product [Phyllotreta striolata]|uniref:Thioredoxin-like fold domain-containing protein n=1 Tax=Phyllotreta striolata TaxID=444603 RepID=A0A9N9TX19_PHYSR|nr:unnamed protein product [Phyllotreta striolata]
MEKLKWYERLFGKKLIKCETLSNSNNFDTISTCDVLDAANVTGVYFSFANINLHSDEFINKLRDLYERFRNEGGNEEKKFEVVQVVMWAHNDNYGDIESSHRESLMGLSWFAVPFSEIDLKTRLSRRYRIKSGVPTLVLLNRDGSTVTVSAQEKLLEDPSGSNFPWRPRPVEHVLKDIVLQPGGSFYSEHKNFTKEDIRYENLPEGIKGFYFSANWCPPCRAFTPQLADIYRIIRKKEPNFEIIFVSSDR